MSIPYVVDGETDLDSLLFNPIIDRINGLNDGSVPIALAGIEGALGEWEVSAEGGGRFNAALYGASANAADNIPFINAAIEACYAAGGGTVYVPTHKVFPIRPSTTSQVYLRSGVTLDLGDARLKVANDSPAYQRIVTAYGGPSAALRKARITGGEIDQNPDGHALSDVSVNGQWIVLLYGDTTDFSLDGVSLICCGTNAISISGSGCKRIRAHDNTAQFIQSNSTAPNYDNSTFYFEANGISVTDNRFYSEHSEQARGAFELHGPMAVARGNQSWNYWTLCNLVSADTALDASVDAYLVSLSGNVAYGARHGITIWPRANTTYRSVSIINNQLYISQIAGDWTSFWGIGSAGAQSVDGDLDGLSIVGNMVSFDLDNRSTTTAGHAFDWSQIHGVGIGDHSIVRNATISANTILNSPNFGMRFGNLNFSGSELENVSAEGNLIVNAGSNRAMHKDVRPSLGFFGKFTRTRVRRNTIVDTLADGTANDSRWLWVRSTATSGGGNLLAENDVIAPSGHNLSELTNEAVLPMRRRAAATTLGTVTGKQEVFDQYGASLGFVPIYDAIT